MPRLRGVEKHELTAEGAALLELARKTGAPDPAMAAIFVRSAVGRGYLEVWNRMMGRTDLPMRLKELVRIYIATGRECGYCATVRSRAAAEEGVTEDLIAEMLDFEFSTEFTAQEKMALRFATVYRDQPERVATDDALWLELRAQFDEVQIIELCVFLTFNVGGGRLTKAAGLLSWEDACELKPKLREVMQRKAERERGAATAHVAVFGAAQDKAAGG